MRAAFDQQHQWPCSPSAKVAKVSLRTLVCSGGGVQHVRLKPLAKPFTCCVSVVVCRRTTGHTLIDGTDLFWRMVRMTAAFRGLGFS
jgi:hypothetical protein